MTEVVVSWPVRARLWWAATLLAALLVLPWCIAVEQPYPPLAVLLVVAAANAVLVVVTVHRRLSVGPTFDYSGVATVALLVLSGPLAAIVAHTAAKLAGGLVHSANGERPAWAKTAFNMAWGVLCFAFGWTACLAVRDERWEPIVAGAAYWFINGLLVGPMAALAQRRPWRDGLLLALGNDGWLRAQEAVMVLFAVLAWRSHAVLAGGVGLLMLGMAMTSRRLLREYDAALLARQEADAEHQRAEFEASRARLDALTGLPNRHALAEAFDTFARPASGTAVLMIDLDHFKQINDRYGHAAGDAALIEVAGAIRGALRAGDFSARLGGEEFCALLAEVGSDVQLTELAERLRQAVASVRVAAYPLVRVTASIGASRLEAGQGLAEALHAADLATYRAKAGGRNRVELSAAA